MFVTRKEALVLAVVALMATTGIAAGCSLITSYDGFASSSTAPLGCGKEIPAQPPASTGGGDKTFVGTMSFIRFIDQDDASTLGYDLDKLCTCPGKQACHSLQGAGKPCDVPAGTGVDNAGGAVLNQLNFGAGGDALTEKLRRGRSGLVVQIKNFNGARDDADVTVSLYNVVGVNGKTDGTGVADFKGSDEMIVADDSLLNVDTLGPKYTDLSAYVADGVLVASLDFPLRLEIPNPVIDASSIVFVPMKTGHLIGKIETVGASGLRMTDAQFVGRITQAGIFEQLGRLGVCQDGGAFAGIKESTCLALDLPTAPAMDGKDQACDALSLAIGVVVSPARLAGHAPVVDPPSLCGQEPAATCN